MSEYLVEFTDGSTCCVLADGYHDAVSQAKRVFPRKHVSSVQRARRVYG